MRRHGRIDANQPEIVAALRRAGRSVEITSALGKGRPDILVGWGRRYLRQLEIKADDGELTDDQVKWFDAWQGPPILIVRTIEEALEATGVTCR